MSTPEYSPRFGTKLLAISLKLFPTNGLVFMKSQIPWNLDDFTIELYVDLLKHLKQTYAIVPFCCVPQQKNKQYLILRHDIDYSLPAALHMAQIEHALGIKSTYFVLFTHFAYDLFKQDNETTLKEISRLGHEIGLHYDPKRYESNNQSTTKTLRNEIRQLENLTGKRVRSIARHGGFDRDPFASTRKYINANHPYYRSYLFVHDSCRAWTPLEGLITLLRVPQKRAQLLTHPENWQEDKIDRKTLFERLTQNVLEKDLPMKERIRKMWATDPLVLKYDLAIRNENFLLANWKSRYKSKPTLVRELSYFNRLFQWGILNSKTGWQIHQLISKIRTRA